MVAYEIRHFDERMIPAYKLNYYQAEVYKREFIKLKSIGFYNLHGVIL